MEKICIISQRYPCEETPTVHVFVQKLAWEMADLGKEVVVISPVPVWSRSLRSVKRQYEEWTPKGNRLIIYRLRFFYFGERNLFGIRLSRWSAVTMTRSCSDVIKKWKILPDVFYGHFICVAGICACRLGRRFDKPSFIAYGESTDWSIQNFGLKNVQRDVSSCAGFVAVSSNNKKRLLENGVTQEDKVEVFVNGVDANRFYPCEKRRAREKWGLPQDRFIVSYVGQFSERKGILRVLEAVNQCKDVFVICAGRGKLIPQGEKVLFCGQVKPEEIPSFLSASDVFVLPTQNEGCSNAILEALACGIPIVSSDCAFNYDILDDKCAILVNPNSPKELAEAISELQCDEEKRKKMAESALKKSTAFTLEKRAGGIWKWMEKKSDSN